MYQSGRLTSTNGWEKMVDSGEKLMFPLERVCANLRPNIVLRSANQLIAHFIELTEP